MSEFQWLVIGILMPLGFFIFITCMGMYRERKCNPLCVAIPEKEKCNTCEYGWICFPKSKKEKQKTEEKTWCNICKDDKQDAKKYTIILPNGNSKYIFFFCDKCASRIFEAMGAPLLQEEVEEEPKRSDIDYCQICNTWVLKSLTDFTLFQPDGKTKNYKICKECAEKLQAKAKKNGCLCVKGKYNNYGHYQKECDELGIEPERFENTITGNCSKCGEFTKVKAYKIMMNNKDYDYSPSSYLYCEECARERERYCNNYGWVFKEER